LSLEEINEKFGDEVIVYLTKGTEKQREDLANIVQVEHEETTAQVLEGRMAKVASREV